tara:strand:- start:716 stop:1834 length:1119 start_codon:yes stop_codon:yes gene_type:complete
MPAKSTAKSTRNDTTKAKTEEDAKELSGWKSFEASMLGESESDVPKRKKEEPIFDLVSNDTAFSMGKLRETRMVVHNINSDFEIEFAREKLLKKTKVLRRAFLSATDPKFRGVKMSRVGVTLYKEVNDDLLSSDPSDKQISYYPVGDVAIGVSNSTNGVDQYSIKFECDLSKNILITTSDGVEYCMPFDVVKSAKPDGSASLLTIEQEKIAGIYSKKKGGGKKGRGKGKREDPYAIEKAAKKTAEKIGMDDARIMGGSDPRKGISSSLDFGSSDGSMSGGKKASKSKKAKASRKRRSGGTTIAKSKKAKARQSPAQRAKSSKAASRRQAKSQNKSGISSSSPAKSKKAKAAARTKSKRTSNAPKMKVSKGGY